MSRVDLAKTVKRIAATATVTPADKRTLEVVASMLGGGWTPPTASRRTDGYKCLGWVRDQWVELVWDIEATCWWSQFGFVPEPDAYAPLPVAPRKAGAAA